MLLPLSLIDQVVDNLFFRCAPLVDGLLFLSGSLDILMLLYAGGLDLLLFLPLPILRNLLLLFQGFQAV